jgi:hypothetical protein
MTPCQEALTSVSKQDGIRRIGNSSITTITSNGKDNKMPAKSKSQQSAFAIALKARKGEIPKEELKGASKLLFNDKTLSDSQLTDYASTERKKLPRKIGTQIHSRPKR